MRARDAGRGCGAIELNDARDDDVIMRAWCMYCCEDRRSAAATRVRAGTRIDALRRLRRRQTSPVKSGVRAASVRIVGSPRRRRMRSMHRAYARARALDQSRREPQEPCSNESTRQDATHVERIHRVQLRLNPQNHVAQRWNTR